MNYCCTMTLINEDHQSLSESHFSSCVLVGNLFHWHVKVCPLCRYSWAFPTDALSSRANDAPVTIFWA